jgi:hypothetical protein
LFIEKRDGQIVFEKIHYFYFESFISIVENIGENKRLIDFNSFVVRFRYPNLFVFYLWDLIFVFVYDFLDWKPFFDVWVKANEELLDEIFFFPWRIVCKWAGIDCTFNVIWVFNKTRGKRLKRKRIIMIESIKLCTLLVLKLKDDWELWIDSTDKLIIIVFFYEYLFSFDKDE